MPRVKEGEEAAPSKPAMKLSEAWGDTAFRAALTSNFAHGWANMGVRVSVVPLFAAAMFNNGSAVAGFALAAYAFGTAVVLQFSGRVADTIGRRPLILAGLTGTAIFVGVFGFAESVPVLIILSALAGAAGGLTNPAQQAVIADVIGNERSGGQVLSVFQMAMDLGSIGGPPWWACWQTSSALKLPSPFAVLSPWWASSPGYLRVRLWRIPGLRCAVFRRYNPPRWG